MKYVVELPMLPTALAAPFTMPVAADPELTVSIPAVVKLPPVILAAEVIVLVAEIKPPVSMLPPVTLPLTLRVPDVTVAAPTVAEDTADPIVAVPVPTYIPCADALLPPVTDPDTVIVPVELLPTPKQLAADPPVALPVKLTTPVELLLIPEQLTAPPPTAFAVIFNVPVDVTVIPNREDVPADPFTVNPLPLMFSVFPLAAENVKQVVVPAVIWLLTVSVLPPVDTVNEPPATAVVPAVVLRLATVISWSIVTVLPFA